MCAVSRALRPRTLPSRDLATCSFVVSCESIQTPRSRTTLLGCVLVVPSTCSDRLMRCSLVRLEREQNQIISVLSSFSCTTWRLQRHSRSGGLAQTRRRRVSCCRSQLYVAWCNDNIFTPIVLCGGVTLYWPVSGVNEHPHSLGWQRGVMVSGVRR